VAYNLKVTGPFASSNGVQLKIDIVKRVFRAWPVDGVTETSPSIGGELVVNEIDSVVVKVGSEAR
jgi:hypothetical protein